MLRISSPIMSTPTLFQWLLIALVSQSIVDPAPSFQMSVIKGGQFQCASAACPPSTVANVSNLCNCQMACLNQVLCQAASFQQSTSYCELFFYTPNQNQMILTSIDRIAMIIIPGTRVPSGMRIIGAYFLRTTIIFELSIEICMTDRFLIALNHQLLKSHHHSASRALISIVE